MSGIPQTLDRSGIENQIISNFEFFDQRSECDETDVASGLAGCRTSRFERGAVILATLPLIAVVALPHN